MRCIQRKRLKILLDFNDALIGINNRNLKTLKTDINITYDIQNILINHNGPLISESGIKTKKELLEISKKTKVKTFLIGESLLRNLIKTQFFQYFDQINPYFKGFLAIELLKRTFVEH